MNTVILMAGSSNEFFKDGSKFPKFLYEINGKPLVEHVYNNLKSLNSNFIFVINAEDAQKWHLNKVIELIDPSAKVITINNETQGAACSALYAIDHISNDEELVLTNGDQIINADLNNIINDLKLYDAGTVVFESIHPRWSYVKTDENNHVIEASEKKPISKQATAGIYYYKKGKDFIESASSMIKKDTHTNGQFYICPTFNELILNNKTVGASRINREHYHSLTSVKAIEEYSKELI
ncbi:glycosyltransferase family 2 protein [Halobacteriovorax sp. DPLXC-1]|uniref:glycosyltransferase family 2 protein n=1 Tax=Halobacteriovorax sp. DPLXC-1 TaxID=3110771 RepID=UPI002FF150D8